MRRLSAAAVLVAALSGCGEGEGDDRRPPLTVSAAASLSEPLGSLRSSYRPARLRFSFAGSDELAAQIRRGVRPDVFAAANTALPDALAREGLAERPEVFAINELVLAVPAGSTGVASVEGAGRSGVTLALGAPSVPVGEYTRTVLDRLSPATRRAVLANVRSEEPDVRGVVGKIAQRAVDAGFVYRSDARAAGGRVRAIGLSRRLRPRVAYGAVVIRGARHPAAARAFVRSLRAGEGQRALRGAGFGPPP